jgi:hypothetical protein
MRMSRISPPLACLINAWLALLLGGCSSLPPRDPLQVSLAGMDPLPSESLELRFAVTLRLQNPNDRDVDYDGVALELELNGQPLASGVAPAAGVVPRFGEALVRVPVSVSAYSVLRQGWAAAVSPGRPLAYAIRGKLSTGPFGSLRFESQGDFDWHPMPPASP